MGIFLYFLLSIQVWAQTGTSIDEAPKQPKYGFSYWSMLTGPGLGTGFSESVDSNGQVVSGNYFQALFANYNVSQNTQVGIQLRTTNDLNASISGSSGIQILNPRIVAHQKNIVDNSWINLSLQPFLEIPTTSVSRSRTNLFSTIFAQNWTFKTNVKDLTLFASTMFSGRFYRQDSGYSTFEAIFMPMVTYQITKKWQAMAWGWFDSNHVGDADSFLGSWNDDYARLGLNYFLLPNVQIFPCAQVYTNNIQLNTTTLGLELAAQF